MKKKKFTRIDFPRCGGVSVGSVWYQLGYTVFSRPGRSQGLLYKLLRYWLIQWWFVKISLQRRHALTVTDSAFSQKIDHVTILKEILNPYGNPNRITGSKVTAILLNGWCLPIGGASSGRVCACSLRSRLVLKLNDFWFYFWTSSIGLLLKNKN